MVSEQLQPPQRPAAFTKPLVANESQKVELNNPDQTVKIQPEPKSQVDHQKGRLCSVRRDGRKLVHRLQELQDSKLVIMSTVKDSFDPFTFSRLSSLHGCLQSL